MHRAHAHLKDLETKRDAWIKAALETVVEEPDPEGSGYYAAYVTPPVPDHASLSLKAGDCLQCLRSALDHLAFELAAAFTSPMTHEIEQDSEFPILGNKDGRGQERFNQRRAKGALAGQPAPGSGLAKTRGMDPAAQAVIEGLQPYHRGNQYESDPLWQLSFLTNIDKHRTIHVVGTVMEGATMPVGGPNLPVNVAALGLASGEPFMLEIKGDIAAEGRTKVARWPMIPIDPGKEMHMGFKPVLDIAFDFATPLVGGKGTGITLGNLHDYLLSDVFPPLIPFLK